MNIDTIEENQVILVDKPKGWTSFDAVKKIKSLSGNRKLKIGHAGTLDPLATGLLIMCTGKQTKNISSFQDMPKVYRTTMLLGGQTTTYDSEFPPTLIKPDPQITEEKLREILPQFIGDIQQIPPIYSALKVNGKRSYQLAREGQTVELQSRKVTVHSIEIISHTPHYIFTKDGIEYPLTQSILDITCSKGTYIRSIAHDMGKALGCGGFLQDLRRLAIGSYTVELESQDEITYCIKKI